MVVGVGGGGCRVTSLMRSGDEWGATAGIAIYWEMLNLRQSAMKWPASGRVSVGWVGVLKKVGVGKGAGRV